MILYGHPFSSYTWKAAIALDEKGLTYEFRTLGPDQAEHQAELSALWPLAKFPVIDDGGTAVAESSIIIEHLDLHHPGPRLITADPAQALAVRFMDRVFDNHVMGNMQAIVSEHLPFVTPTPDQGRIDRAKAALVAVYAWLEANLPDARWACGDDFSLADCAAAPALFYADWTHPIAETHPRLRAYRARLLARPSVARAVDGARPYRHFWPLGPAPERD
ncbi:glutathione S-transferase family protein [Erythrobacter colymbi]|uniref:glutathione S-transferase family protein n=1 Tax=Erythrobacter colymbi TaxID=1161202 RepID=UPI000A3A4D58|nr:glutathione S-transferase family protein [Erythrobacter colymbi]